MKLNKNFIKVLGPILLILGLGILLPLLILKNNSETSYAPEEKIITINNHKSVEGEAFPRLHQQDFYKYIRVDHGKPYISDKFIAAVITHVVKKAKIVDGDIKYNFVLSEAKTNVKFQFWWQKGNIIIDTKQYEFNISV